MRSEHAARLDRLRERLRRALGEVDVERMTPAARRHYLRSRLREIDRLIEITLYQQMQELAVPPSSWELMGDESEPWEEALDLHYLEASRQAIWQTLRDLNRTAYGSSWPTASEPSEPAEGVDPVGYTGDC